MRGTQTKFATKSVITLSSNNVHFSEYLREYKILSWIFVFVYLFVCQTLSVMGGGRGYAFPKRSTSRDFVSSECKFTQFLLIKQTSFQKKCSHRLANCYEIVANKQRILIGIKKIKNKLPRRRWPGSCGLPCNFLADGTSLHLGCYHIHAMLYELYVVILACASVEG